MKSILIAIAALAAGLSTEAAEVTFGGGENLCIDGKEVQLRAGELEPQRIPRAYWRHRIKMCKAMGLNAISSYFMWNDFERPDGSFDFAVGNRDVAAYLTICREEGMWVLFRPGPYVCAEWDFGGLPPRLLKGNTTIRSSDPAYLAEVEKYLLAIAAVARPFLAKNGGPIVLTQIENEYGSWPFKDVAYLRWLKDFWKRQGFGPFYMADGASDKYLKDLIYPDKEIAIGFDPARGEDEWAFARKYNPGVPVLSAETYPGWLRHWGEDNWRPTDLRGTVKWFMAGRKSFCLFVAHGGTSFGFTAGANEGRQGAYQPDLTSYDYGSPINEQGCATKAYYDYREIIGKALGTELPPVPEPIPAVDIAPFAMVRHASLRENVSVPRPFAEPVSLEELDQNQGIAIWRTTLPAGGAAELSFSRIADYAQVFVGGRRLATVDRRQALKPVSVPARAEPQMLEVLVEAMGHVNYGAGMRTDRKGLSGPVTLGGRPLENWTVSLKPLTESSVVGAAKGTHDGLPGGHFRGTFELAAVADTFLDLSRWTKGTLYVNGHNLGRYWNVGPQFSLYCPATVLKVGVNIVDVIELERSEPAPIRGLKANLERSSGKFTENADNVWEEKSELPILGWYGIPFMKVTTERYRQAKDAGFTHLMQWAPDLNGSLKVLDCARSAGIRLLLHSPCIEGEHPEEAVRVLKSHPGLGLYHLTDEPVASKLPALGVRTRKIMAEDPSHPCYMNWCGVVGKDPMVWYGAPDYRSYIAISRREVPTQMISFDKYPVIADVAKIGPAPFRQMAESSLKTNWYETLEIVRDVSRREKIPFWAFSLSTAHKIGSKTYFPAGHAYPTATVGGMKLQQYSNLAYGAQGLQYFTYWGFAKTEMNFHDAPMTFDGEETFVMDRIRAVNAELRARAFVFVGADAKDVWHTGAPIPSFTRPLPQDGLPKGVLALSADGHAVVSHLVNGDDEYLMVVGCELHRDVSVKIRLADGVRRVRTDGSLAPARLHADEYVLSTGDAEIFKL